MVVRLDRMQEDLQLLGVHLDRQIWVDLHCLTGRQQARRLRIVLLDRIADTTHRGPQVG